MENNKIKSVIPKFFGKNTNVNWDVCNTGHINNTFFITVNNNSNSKRYVLQQINDSVFKEPEKVMQNILLVTEFLKNKFKTMGENPNGKVLSIVKTISGNFWWKNKTDNSIWRLFDFIENTKTYDLAESTDIAYQAAKAFGNFTEMLKDFPVDKLNITIPDFHNTAKRFEQFETALDNAPKNKITLAKNEIAFAKNNKNMVNIINEAINNKSVRLCVTHNDTKINNVLIDKRTNEGVCVIDLDIVMPGSILFDFGDCVRTMTSTGKEDEQNLDLININLDLFDAVTRGFLEPTKNSLTKTEKDLLAFAGKLITYEQGLRFLTDFLNGDIYFKTHRENHNLERARTQFKLVHSMNKQKNKINNIINRYS